MAEKRAIRGQQVEVDGIKVNVTIDPSDDYELVECSTVIADQGASVLERNRAYMRRNRIVLGEDYDRVISELRAANGGKLPSDAVLSFVGRVIEAVPQAKN